MAGMKTGGYLPAGMVPSGEMTARVPSAAERLVSTLAQGWFGDTREGYAKAQRLVDVNRMMNPVVSAPLAAYDGARAGAEGRPVEAGANLLSAAGMIAPLRVAQVGAGLPERMLPRPAIKNYVVAPTEGGLLGGRLPAKPSDITYGYRSMSQGELDDALQYGFLRPQPGGNKFTNHDAKWFSAGDESGQFGRTWKGGDAAPVRVRIPRDKIPDDQAIDIADVTRLDKTTGQYAPVLTRRK